ncbi:MAG: hypothetical protein H0U59_04220 [Gemmatimonadaceae bacterium]|nr:hypothetical protein [Gemmatimonadaceae bacterium]
MLLLQRAYATGCQAALAKFASDPTDAMISSLGAVHPGAAAIGAGFTAPDGYGIGQAVRTGLSAGAGTSLGEIGGERAAKLLAGLLKQNPELFAQIGKHLGATVGGGFGAHAGHAWANRSMMDDMRKKQMGG